MFSLEENKKSKGRRQPLSKLPRHHPLVLQDCVSDDETSEQLIPEEEAEETEAWAKPLSQLWQKRPPNFEAEKEFNETMAQQAPHCSVCMIFQIYNQVSPRLPLCLPRTSSQREARLIVGTELVTGCLGKGMFF